MTKMWNSPNQSSLKFCNNPNSVGRDPDKSFRPEIKITQNIFNIQYLSIIFRFLYCSKPKTHLIQESIGSEEKRAPLEQILTNYSHLQSMHQEKKESKSGCWGQFQPIFIVTKISPLSNLHKFNKSTFVNWPNSVGRVPCKELKPI